MSLNLHKSKENEGNDFLQPQAIMMSIVNDISPRE